MQWLPGSYKPVTRWINDSKVASINAAVVCRLFTVILVNTMETANSG